MVMGLFFESVMWGGGMAGLKNGVVGGRVRILVFMFWSRNVYCLRRVTNDTGVISRRMEALREVDVYAYSGVPEWQWGPRALSLAGTSDTVTPITATRPVG